MSVQILHGDIAYSESPQALSIHENAYMAVEDGAVRGIWPQVPETYAALAEHPNIVGVKEASGNISQIVKLMSIADGRVDLYSGNDDQIVPLLALGGIGVISVLSNVAPRQTHDICEKFFNGDVAGSCAEQLRAIPLCNALFCEVNPIPVKKALNLMGKEVGSLRAPLTEMEEENAAKLEKAMKEYGIL